MQEVQKAFLLKFKNPKKTISCKIVSLLLRGGYKANSLLLRGEYKANSWTLVANTKQTYLVVSDFSDGAVLFKIGGSPGSLGQFLRHVQILAMISSCKKARLLTITPHYAIIKLTCVIERQVDPLFTECDINSLSVTKDVDPSCFLR